MLKGPLNRQCRAPKRVEKAHFLNFDVTFLEILMYRTETDVGFGINAPELVKINHQRLCSIFTVGQCNSSIKSNINKNINDL